MIVRGDSLIVLEQPFVPLLPGERPQRVMCRMRSLGCSPCTGAVRSTADTVPKIIEELVAVRAVRAPAPRHRPRPGRLDGDEEARRLLLMSGLLRICTAGSVDDGKSTLIGRLLYDSRGVYEDQVQVGRGGVEEPDRRADRLLALHRRPAGRARAGHHDRRRLPLFRDRAAQVHPRRHAGPRAVHAQHGDRRVDGRRRHPARRRAARRARRRRGGTRASRRLLGITNFVLAVNKMDLVDFDRGRLRRHLRRLRGRCCDGARVHADSDERAARRQRHRAERPHALVRRAEPARLSRDRARSTAGTRREPFRFPVQLVAPPGSRLPRLRGTDCLGHGPGRRRGHGLAVGPHRRASSASSPGTATSRWRSRRCR